MIDVGRAAARAGLRRVPAEDLLRQLDGIARALDVELDPVAARARPDLHVAAEGGGQCVLGRPERVGEIGVYDHRLASEAAASGRRLVLGLARSPLGLANRPVA